MSGLMFGTESTERWQGSKITIMTRVEPDAVKDVAHVHHAPGSPAPVVNGKKEK